MGLLNTAVSGWLVDALSTAAGISLTYTRAVGGTSTVTGWVGNTDKITIDRLSGQAVLSSAERDYMIPTSEIAFEPVAGDRIAQTIDGSATVWEVCPQQGLEAVRWSDPERTIYRLHTRRIS